MKRYNLYIITFILGLLLFNGCQDEDLIKKSNVKVEEGIPVVAKLSFSSENRDNKVVTKSALPTATEYKVHDLYVYVFKLEGSSYVKEFGRQFSEDELNITSQKDDTGGTTAGTVTLDITSGEKKIFAIANVGAENHYQLTKKLDEVTTLDELNSLAATLADVTVPVDRGSGRFLMSGSFATNKSNATAALTGGDIAIDMDGNLVSDGKIYLIHLDSRMDFKVKAEPTIGRKANGETTQSITFIPKGYRVVNVPVSSFLFEKTFNASEGSTHDVVGDSQDASAAVGYSDTKEDGQYVNFDELTMEESNTVGGNFSFYMFENRKRALNNITDYAERERQEKNASTGRNEEYINAHKYSTYVEMTGSYFEKYLDENGDLKEKTAEVKYTIHLGFVNGAADFRSERNTQYTYNVKIKGVDNIELEVTSSNDEESGVIENQPGAEGDVVKSKQFYYVDAHYVVDRIVFNKDNVSDNASFRVKTPFDNDGRGDAAKDYKWVWFVKNQKQYVGTGGTKRYIYSGLTYSANSKPQGYSAYAVAGYNSGSVNDPYTRSSKVSKTTISKRTWYYKNESEETINESYRWQYPSSGYVPFPSSTAERINIKELITLLKEKKSEPVSEYSLYDSDGNAAFTVFIDEYYYDTNPINNNNVHWSKFANADNREMHILCDTEYSSDHESSLTTSNFLISQKPIRTFYNTNMATAWGVESVNEPVYSTAKSDGRLPIESASNISDRSGSNGRYNMFKNIGYTSGSSWSTYIDPATNYLKKVNNIALLQQACLQRNRDLNGDGKITHNEVRWYMPAINQMTGLFLGKDALPLEVQLMKNGVTVTRDEGKTDSENYRDFHYTNSNNIQFWAEEGAATGSESMNNGYWDYRCVRNLGVTYNSNDAPQLSNETADYASPKYQSDGSVLIDLSAVTPNALRATDDKGEPLAITDELSEYNRPYKSFYVASGLTSSTVSKSDVYKNSVKNPCPSGWRMPNMRELTLITAYSGFSFGEAIFSQTMSSLSYKKSKQNVYHIVGGGNVSLGDIGSAVVRCVKDKK